MKTGYFNLLRKQKIDGAVCIAIGLPKYVDVPYIYKLLAPSWKLLSDYRYGKVNDEQYIEIFNNKLYKLNAKEVYNELNEIVKPYEPVLMCHCGVYDFCHRHLVAEWFEKELGIEIEEYGIGKVNRKDGLIIKEDDLFEIKLKDHLNKKTKKGIFF